MAKEDRSFSIFFWLPLLVFVLSQPLGVAAEELLLERQNGGKLGPHLAALQQEYELSLTRQGAVPLEIFSPDLPLLTIDDGRVLIQGVATGDPAALLAAMETLGLTGVGVFGSVISGWFPVAALGELEAVTALAFARPSFPRTHAGSVTSQGDLSVYGSLARELFGVDGSGVTVGVLSDSYDCLLGAASDVASGDLPSGVTVLDDSVCTDTLDEGRAMMQIVHDTAPGASLSFHTAFSGQAGFAQGILDLAAAGASVIVDDVIYLEEPMFQDGIIAQAVDDVVASGAAYFSSAGNSARESYEAPLRDSGEFVLYGIYTSGNAHDFDPGPGVDLLQQVVIDEGESMVLTLQWDAPYASVSPGSGGSQTDVDIVLLGADGTTVKSYSNYDNMNGDPVEILGYDNPQGSGETLFNIAIVLFDGPAPEVIKYVLFSGGTVTEFFGTGSPSLYGHANAAGAEAVGASFYQETPAFGEPVPLLEPFSSAGGVPILFNEAGDRLPSAVVRMKPEIVAPDGVNTTFFYPGFDWESDGFPNFFGTSAAAPHAAAVAALLKEHTPSLLPQQVYDALEASGVDMETPGFDYDSGYGLIHAADALRSLAPADAVGVFRAADWFLDNGNGVWDEQIDLIRPGFGLATDLPVAGDWDDDGADEIGVFRGGEWFLDDGDGVWNGSLDTVIANFGAPGDLPVVGDWDGDGIDEVGVFRGGQWFLDDGDGVWNGSLDTVIANFGAPGDSPVAGDWDGDGIDEVGVYRGGQWFLDDGDGIWNGSLDTAFASFGLPSDRPVAGDWDGDGRDEVGVFRGGEWYLDDGDGVWNGALDTTYMSFGAPGDRPVAGFWDMGF